MEAGAGNGRLCREVLRAEPACASALRYVMVERSAPLRAAQRELLTVEPLEYALGPSAPGLEGTPQPVGGNGPIVSALEELPALAVDGVILANELLDNLPFDVVERTTAGWTEIRVGVSDEGAFHEVPVPAAAELIAWLGDLDPPAGTRVPVQRAVEEWIDDCAYRLRHGAVVVVDYGMEAADLAARGGGWLRTYRAHGRGGDPLADPGTQDVTSDVLLPHLRRAARRAGLTVATETDQAAWLRSTGIEDLVAEGRAAWEAGAAQGDLAAIAGRSRVTEAAALTDPAGLGAHSVLIFTKNLASGGR
jgi:SAM-dependent MidA family methyltransferase